MSLNNPYIARKQATEFAQDIKSSIQHPNINPILHYAYGIGGIGKTTLLERIHQEYSPDFQCIKVSFDKAVNHNVYVGSPIELMELIDREISDNAFLRVSPFKKVLQRYKQTLASLETEPIEGEQVTPEQIEEVKRLARGGARAIGFIAATQTDGGIASTSAINPIAEKAADFAVDAGVIGRKAFDLLKKHKATKNEPERQELIKNPLPQLAQAIIQTLRQKSATQPILLILDTYEKALPEFDRFLCSYLLSSQELQTAPVRIVMAGRYPLSNKKYNSTFRRHGNVISEKRLDKFDRSGTINYLEQIGITEKKQINIIWRATKGYPYYLNLIRKQKQNGREIKLTRGGKEMVDLLLYGLNDVERKVVCLAAYCRWFDRTIIEHLIAQNDIEKSPTQDRDWFDWLVNRDFTVDDSPYRFDDVARDVIRQAEHNDSKKDFTNIHQQLFQYFQQLADETVAPDELVAEKYEDPDWCESAIESTYHALYADKKQGQIKLLTHFFEGAYLKEPDVAIKSFTAVISETVADELKLLPGNTKEFLQSIAFAIIIGWVFIQVNLKKHKIRPKSELETEVVASQEYIESDLGKCFKEVENLKGVAKCYGLIGKYVRSKQTKQDLALMNQAQPEIVNLGVERYPELSSSIFLNGGIAKGKLGKHEEAIADLNRAIELNPDDSQTWLIRGGAKGNLGRHEEAIADLDRAIELNSDDPSAWRSRGISNGRLGRYEEAIADLDRAIELNPNDSDARIDRGSANSNLGRYEEAIADLDRATELNSDDPDAWNVKALTMSIRSDFDKATADIDKAMELSPEKVAYVANKGIILARKNEFDAAKNCIEQAESMNSDSEFVYYAKACYFALQNNDRQAIENLRKAIEIDPVHCRREAKKNHDFDRLRDNSEFLALIER